MRIAFTTLGCKVNQYETAVMKEEAKRLSCDIVHYGDEAEVHVINTCTVTSHSDYQSRQLIRKAFKKNSSCKIVVTGCYTETGLEELSRMGGVAAIIGNARKYDINRYLKGLKEQRGQIVAVGDKEDRSLHDQPLINGFTGRARAFLKIQDGCNSSCSYCVIPRIRRKSRSLLPDKVIEQIKLFTVAGFQEVVLTGIHLGTYGKDLCPNTDLSGLIKRIVVETAIPRIRISSIDPQEVDEKLIEQISESDRICRHLHIPLQSGDDETLNRMNRGYTSSYYKDLIIYIKERVPDIGIGTDIMVGFPGETEPVFSNSYRFLNSIPVDFLHVFSFSPRAGTEAALMPGRISKGIMEQRSKTVRDLGLDKGDKFRSTFVGKHLSLVVEGERDQSTGLLKGYSDNYLKILLEGEDSIRGRLVIARIEGMHDGNSLIGRLIS